ncbi:class I SAM-dependent methyltransferase [Alkaliphilus serpentinus]|uniref:Class I SAM-dependent methyltransferase n=1 Tax=Alkaliphilus serpentinus TaxID=1482731 RepID=A0A833HQ93_9FIRM|nr:class I SAM-dependent methyltransferase [Alkaliphilus serpentinus]KAB3531553.1 class I SAM-dependent methyltransferase [Alkaliphilus serpentinus]
MIKKIFEYLKKPDLYAPSTTKFWDDEHISKGMLESHLDPETGASRSYEFMDLSVEWIGKIAPANVYNQFLDLGCGPGLYAERFVKKGYSITGIDYSKRSVAYATEKAVERGDAIKYIYQNYLDIDYENEFDVIILIYCDYGVLNPSQRSLLLKKVYKALKKGGKFILDVFSPKFFDSKKESNIWYMEEGGGFWRPDTYLCLESHFIYDKNTRLDQHVLVDINGDVEVIRVFEHCFSKEDLKKEMKDAGFGSIEFFSDVAGKPFDEESKTICIVTTK